MNTLTHQFRPFRDILSHDPMPKKDFMKLAHGKTTSANQYLVNLMQMIQFSRVYREGDQIILE